MKELKIIKLNANDLTVEEIKKAVDNLKDDEMIQISFIEG